MVQNLNFMSGKPEETGYEAKPGRGLGTQCNVESLVLISNTVKLCNGFDVLVQIKRTIRLCKYKFGYYE